MQLSSALLLVTFAIGILAAPVVPGNANSGSDTPTALFARGDTDTNSPAQGLKRTRERSLSALYDEASDFQSRSLEYRSSDFDSADEVWISSRVVPAANRYRLPPAAPAGAGTVQGTVDRARVGPFGKAKAGFAREGKAIRKLAKSVFNEVRNRGRNLHARAAGDEEFELARSLEGLKGEVIVLCSLELE